MKVVYDARWLRVDNLFDGISRYSHELGRAMSRHPGLELVWLISDERQLALLPERDFILANAPTDIVREMGLPQLLNKNRPDIVYSPFFLMGTAGREYRQVLTIHDLIYFHHRTPPQYVPQAARVAWRIFYSAKWPMRKVLDQADIVATVSDTAKQGLLDWHMTKRPIVTVSNAVSHEVTPKPAEHHESRDILYMGAFTPYKNVELLIDAIALLETERLHLLSPMPPSRRKVLAGRIRDRGVTDRVVIHNGVTDEVYRTLLHQCRCLITASRLEGFGLPIIEAQQQAVPVACSRIPIFQEVTGDSALFFSPDDPQECAAAIRAFGDAGISRTFIAKGLANAARFTWDASAAAAADICARLMSHPGADASAG